MGRSQESRIPRHLSDAKSPSRDRSPVSSCLISSSTVKRFNLFFVLHPLVLKSTTKIIAIGRNYLDHVKELNNPIPKEPFFFLKPTSSYLPSQTPGAKVQIPRGVLAHHEGSFPTLSPSSVSSQHTSPVELGLVIGTPGRDISQEDALDHIAGYSQSPSPFPKSNILMFRSALAVDMTARNVQDVAKAKGLPWAAAKGMDTFTPVG